jgi:hypothetical protein
MENNEEGGDDPNPILHASVLLTCDERAVYIDILPNDEEDQPTGMVVGADVGVVNHGIRKQMLAIQSVVSSDRRKVLDIRYEMREKNIIMT